MDSRYVIPSLDRALDVLELLAVQHRDMGLAEIQRATDIPKSSLFRILTTLQKRGCLKFDADTKRFGLGMKLWEFGDAFLHDLDLYSVAVPVMKRLAEETGESVFLGVLDESEVIYLLRMESPKSIMVIRKLEQRAPAHCTATGEAMLAFLPKEEMHRILDEHALQAFNPKTVTDRRELEARFEHVRREGVAVVDGEYNDAVLCVSAPIVNKTHRPCASLTVAMLSAQVADNQVRIDEVSGQVREAARQVSRELGYLADQKRTTGDVSAVKNGH